MGYPSQDEHDHRPGNPPKRMPTQPPTALDTQVGGDHYKVQGIQPVEFIQANKLNFFEGSAVKYITRHRLKNGKQDLEKAIHYIQMLIEFEYPEKTASAETPPAARGEGRTVVIHDLDRVPGNLEFAKREDVTAALKEMFNLETHHRREVFDPKYEKVNPHGELHFIEHTVDQSMFREPVRIMTLLEAMTYPSNLARKHYENADRQF